MIQAIERARLVLLEARASHMSAWEDAGALAELLYLRWYHQATEARRLFPDAAAYRAAHTLGAGLEAGWRVTALQPAAGPGAILAERGAEQRLVRPPDYAPATANRLRVTPGDPVLITARIDELHGAFWHLWSVAWRKRSPDRLLRVYFQVAPRHEATFVARFAAAAPNTQAWTMKILAGAQPAGRSDAAVLYLDREGGIGAEWVVTLIDRVASLLDAGGPPLTAPLAPGVAWAEDPGDGKSFGEDRCGRLAGAALANPAALEQTAAWEGAVAQAFARDGLAVAQPHLSQTDRRLTAHVG